MNKNILPICKKVLEDYIFAFNMRDYEGMANLFNFPHIRFANDNVSIISKDEYLKNQDNVTKLLKNENWHHTDIKNIKSIQSGQSKCHFECHFLRLDIEGNITHDFKTLWIVTKVKGHWGIQFRSSFLTSKAATFGKTIN
jgi:hypothetical protein